jgi:hypothetical protein
MKTPPADPAQLLTERLAKYLGPQAAANTVEGFCRRHAGKAPAALSGAELVGMLPRLQPLLSVFLGTTKTEVLLQQLGKELAR